MRVAKSGYFFLCAAFLFAPLANGAQARDIYQRTKDGKTLVWKSSSKLGHTATWTGDRDAEGYATGNGTLTWLTVRQSKLTGFNMPFSKYTVVSRYSGKMVHGKFTGLVTKADTSGTLHGKFVDGRRTGKWIAGAAPKSSTPREEPVKVAEQTAPAVEQPATEKLPRAIAVTANTETEPEPPAAGPNSEAKAEKPARPTPDVAIATKQSAAKPVAPKQSNEEMDDSLKSLVGPPSLLRAKQAAAAPKPSEPPKISESAPPASVPAVTTSSPPTNAPTGPRLSANEVIDLANAEARKQGYDLKTYQHPQADYTAANETWSVSYDQINADGVGNHFSITVEDKTKKSSVASDR